MMQEGKILAKLRALAAARLDLNQRIRAAYGAIRTADGYRSRMREQIRRLQDPRYHAATAQQREKDDVEVTRLQTEIATTTKESAELQRRISEIARYVSPLTALIAAVCNQLHHTEADLGLAIGLQDTGRSGTKI